MEARRAERSTLAIVARLGALEPAVLADLCVHEDRPSAHVDLLRPHGHALGGAEARPRQGAVVGIVLGLVLLRGGQEEPGLHGASRSRSDAWPDSSATIGSASGSCGPSSDGGDKSRNSISEAVGSQARYSTRLQSSSCLRWLVRRSRLRRARTRSAGVRTSRSADRARVRNVGARTAASAPPGPPPNAPTSFVSARAASCGRRASRWGRPPNGSAPTSLP